MNWDLLEIVIVNPTRKNQILLWEPLAKLGVGYACFDG